MQAFLSKIKYFKETLYHQFSYQVAILFGPKNGYWNQAANPKPGEKIAGVWLAKEEFS